MEFRIANLSEAEANERQFGHYSLKKRMPDDSAAVPPQRKPSLTASAAGNSAAAKKKNLAELRLLVTLDNESLMKVDVAGLSNATAIRKAIHFKLAIESDSTLHEAPSSSGASPGPPLTDAALLQLCESRLNTSSRRLELFVLPSPSKPFTPSPAPPAAASTSQLGRKNSASSAAPAAESPRLKGQPLPSSVSRSSSSSNLRQQQPPPPPPPSSSGSVSTAASSARYENPPRSTRSRSNTGTRVAAEIVPEGFTADDFAAQVAALKQLEMHKKDERLAKNYQALERRIYMEENQSADQQQQQQTYRRQQQQQQQQQQSAYAPVIHSAGPDIGQSQLYNYQPYSQPPPQQQPNRSMSLDVRQGTSQQQRYTQPSRQQTQIPPQAMNSSQSHMRAPPPQQQQQQLSQAAMHSQRKPPPNIGLQPYHPSNPNSSSNSSSPLYSSPSPQSHYPPSFPGGFVSPVAVSPDYLSEEHRRYSDESQYNALHYGRNASDNASSQNNNYTLYPRSPVGSGSVISPRPHTSHENRAYNLSQDSRSQWNSGQAQRPWSDANDQFSEYTPFPSVRPQQFSSKSRPNDNLSNSQTSSSSRADRQSPHQSPVYKYSPTNMATNVSGILPGRNMGADQESSRGPTPPSQSRHNIASSQNKSASPLQQHSSRVPQLSRLDQAPRSETSSPVGRKQRQTSAEPSSRSKSAAQPPLSFPDFEDDDDESATWARPMHVVNNTPPKYGTSLESTSQLEDFPRKNKLTAQATASFPDFSDEEDEEAATWVKRPDRSAAPSTKSSPQVGKKLLHMLPRLEIKDRRMESPEPDDDDEHMVPIDPRDFKAGQLPMPNISTADTPMTDSFAASPTLPRITEPITSSAVLRRKSFREKENWAVRPRQEDILTNLDEFFPQTDLDKPVLALGLDNIEEVSSPLTAGPSAAKHERSISEALRSSEQQSDPVIRTKRLENRKSIRIVASEQKKLLDKRKKISMLSVNGPTEISRRRSTRLWGREMAEVAPGSSPAINAATSKTVVQWVRGELIGKGTYGRVYLALNGLTGEPFAVKQVELPTTASDREDQRQTDVVKALRGEIEMLKDLHHKHIVEFLGVEEKGDYLSVFLEYVDGGSIGRCFRKHGKFETTVVQSFTSQILQGLAYLHSKGILHRDLKADNMLVDLEGNVKISDFGVSKQTENIYEDNTQMSMQGSVFWMAPEVINSFRDNKKTGYSAKADIWALGCVVLEMFAGRRPWGTTEAVAAMLALGSKRCAPPIPSDVTLSANAADLLERCWLPNPNMRPQAKELLAHNFMRLPNGWTFQQSKLAKVLSGSDR